MAGTFDVTVRVPVGFESPAAMAGWLSGAVERAMAENNWMGGCALLFRKGEDGDGPIVMFHEGFVDPYEGVLPHGLAEPGGLDAG